MPLQYPRSNLTQAIRGCWGNESYFPTAFTLRECLSRCVRYTAQHYTTRLKYYVQASADKIIREMELFGPDFEKYEEVQEAEDQNAAASTTVETSDAPGSVAAEPVAAVPEKDKSKAKKGKLQAKATGHTYQFQIMESIGVPRAEIKKFADPLYWLTYFPPIAVVCILLCNTMLL